MNLYRTSLLLHSPSSLRGCNRELILKWAFQHVVWGILKCYWFFDDWFLIKIVFDKIFKLLEIKA
jgi:hypothetical protein